MPRNERSIIKSVRFLYGKPGSCRIINTESIRLRSITSDTVYVYSRPLANDQTALCFLCKPLPTLYLQLTSITRTICRPLCDHLSATSCVPCTSQASGLCLTLAAAYLIRLPLCGNRLIQLWALYFSSSASDAFVRVGSCLRLTASFLTSWRGSKMTVPGYRDIHRNTSLTSCT